MSRKSEQNLVVNALERSQYEWRTLRGIAQETELSLDKVAEVLADLISQKVVRKSFVPSPTGADLYGLVSRVDADIRV